MHCSFILLFLQLSGTFQSMDGTPMNLDAVGAMKTEKKKPGKHSFHVSLDSFVLVNITDELESSAGANGSTNATANATAAAAMYPQQSHSELTSDTNTVHGISYSVASSAVDIFGHGISTNAANYLFKDRQGRGMGDGPTDHSDTNSPPRNSYEFPRHQQQQILHASAPPSWWMFLIHAESLTLLVVGFTYVSGVIVCTVDVSWNA